MMGQVAARLSDVALLTSDNPRDEDPEEHHAEVLAGIAGRPAPSRDSWSSPTAGWPSAAPSTPRRPAMWS